MYAYVLTRKENQKLRRVVTSGEDKERMVLGKNVVGVWDSQKNTNI